ncbi:hypothetical protein D3C71_1342020 [compost metagenome]
MAADVAGHQVRGELHAGVVQLQGLRQGAHQQGLAQPGHAFDQHVAAGQQCDQNLLQHISLADEGVAYRIADALDTFNQLGVARCGRRHGRVAGKGGRKGRLGHSWFLIWMSKRIRSRRAVSSRDGGTCMAVCTREIGHCR